jgi:hypothetical protein
LPSLSQPTALQENVFVDGKAATSACRNAAISSSVSWNCRFAIQLFYIRRHLFGLSMSTAQGTQFRLSGTHDSLLMVKCKFSDFDGRTNITFS